MSRNGSMRLTICRRSLTVDTLQLPANQVEAHRPCTWKSTVKILQHGCTTKTVCVKKDLLHEFSLQLFQPSPSNCICVFPTETPAFVLDCIRQIFSIPHLFPLAPVWYMTCIVSLFDCSTPTLPCTDLPSSVPLRHSYLSFGMPFNA